MASAILPSRNEGHWGAHKVYIKKLANQKSNYGPHHHFSTSTLNPNHTPNFHPCNPIINRSSIQNPINNSPSPCGYGHYSSSRTLIKQNEEPLPRYSAPLVAASSISVDLEKESSHGRYVVFHLDSYSRIELKELRNRFKSELERVRMFRYQIETREQVLRFSHSVSVHPPLLQLNSTTAAAISSATPPNAKTGTPPGKTNKVSGQKRAMPFASSKKSKYPANPAMLNSTTTRKVEVAMMRRCGQILAKLMKHKHGWVFNKPVDTVALGLHNYFDVIKHPMDLGTVKAKLSKHMYGSPLDFASDMRLTFKNALTYNPQGDDAHTMANILLNMFEEMFIPAYHKFEAERQRILVAQQNLKKLSPNLMQSQVKPSQQDTRKPPPPLPHLALSNRSSLTQAPSAMVPPSESGAVPLVEQKKPPKPKANAPSKREMSHEERDKLVSSLQDLPGERIDEMLKIITKRNPEPVAFEGDGEVELDIQAIDNDTMWELDRFVTLHNKACASNTKKGELISNSTPAVHVNKDSHIVVPMIQEVSALTVHKTNEDVDIGEEMPLNNYPPLEIEKDDPPSRASSGSSSSSDSDSSSSDSDSESSSGSDTADSVESPCAE